jgi:hypothetical protein
MTYIDISAVQDFVRGKKFDEIKEECVQKGVTVRESSALKDVYLLVVDKDKENDDNLTLLQRQCNGIVLEKDSNKLVAACQNKLINIKTQDELLEAFQNKTEDTQVETEYCEDGTVIRLYNYNEIWYTSTTRCVTATDSYWSSNKTFDAMFWELFGNDKVGMLDVNCTYIFVILHKENRIVVNHIANKLVYVSCINNASLI